MAEGTTSPWRIFTDLAFVGIVVLALDLAIRLWRKDTRVRAVVSAMSYDLAGEVVRSATFER